MTNDQLHQSRRTTMSKILFVTSSPRDRASYSNQVAKRVVEDLQDADASAVVTVRDLARNPLPHVDDDFVAATRGAEGPQTDRQRALRELSDELVDELFAADTIVIAAPMINFAVASTLKAWIDFVARAGRTFRYSEAGPEGLVKGKRVVVVAASGGIYSGNNGALDFQVPWLKGVLGFLGMTDVEVIRVEGTAFGPEAADKALATAHAKARDLVGVLAAA